MTVTRTDPADLRGQDVLVRPEARLPAGVAAAAAQTFGFLSGLRGERIFHPRGVTFGGRARLHGDAVGLLAQRPDAEVLVRVSRGVGLPHPLPDFNGVAVRLLDAHGDGRHQDLLMVSASGAPVARNLLTPLPFFTSSGYSTVLPYRTPSGLRLFRARALTGATTEALAASVPFDLRIERAPLFGPWEPVADVTLDEQVDPAIGEALRFDPWHTGDDLVPAGFFNRLRLPAYAASQAARPR